MENFKKVKNVFLIFACISLFLSCSKKEDNMNQYVIEVTTFQYKNKINSEAFWARDAKIESDYTSKQNGFISRESAYSKESKEVVVIVRWETNADADASMQKFMSDKSVADYAEMIEPSTMKMTRYKKE